MQTKAVKCGICFKDIIVGQQIVDVTLETLPRGDDEESQILADASMLPLGVVHRNNQNQCLRKAKEMEQRFLESNSN